eukprot:TRINITY_DN10982_c0_g1_i2.p1 TRINITY_DN10982_c0_g1~~TRINITY_DN10982_c0_g1_i2.p1  ORF type:complete len:140 (+),score=7.05 TRINITY_DN10982_c0_g1_i2:126-545(+)
MDTHLQRKAKNPWHNLVRKYKAAHNGCFRAVGSGATAVNGIVGLLYSKSLFCELYKVNEDYKNGHKHSSVHYVLQLTKICYSEEDSYAEETLLDVKYTLPQTRNEPCLLIEADSKCNMAVVALNSVSYTHLTLPTNREV